MSFRLESELRVGPDADPDRYALGAAVASGAEGILYRGSITTVTGLEFEVAIKMLQPRFLPRVDEWHARWSEQVELLRSLQVPGVVRVRDGFIGPLPHAAGAKGEGRTLYLVMNWVEGEALDEWVAKRPDRDPLETLMLLLGVASALDLMHSGAATGGMPVVHRDVKPSNILVTEEGTVLVDFGLTRGLPEGLRLSGVTGTPGYLAPEANTAGIYTPATDRYAFGAVAYFVLTGIEPPTTHQPDALRTALMSVPTLRDRPDALRQVMSMLATDPMARPASLVNWVAQLRHSSLTGLPEVLAPPAPRRHHAASASAAPADRVGRFRRRGATLLVIAAILLVAIPATLMSLTDARSDEASRTSHTTALAVTVASGWRTVEPGPLDPRDESEAVWTGKEVIVVGGFSKTDPEYSPLTDGAAFEPSSGQWRSIRRRPIRGAVMRVVWTGEEMVTFDAEGFKSAETLFTVTAFNPATNRWRLLRASPSTMMPRTAAWTGREVLTWQPGSSPSPGGLYDPKEDSWKPIPQPPTGTVIDGRSKAVWTDGHLVVQGSWAASAGGAASPRLLIYNPLRNEWTLGPPLPENMIGWPDVRAVSAGRETLFRGSNERGERVTYLFNPGIEQWRKIADPEPNRSEWLPAENSDDRSVVLADGRVVVRSASLQGPFQILQPETGTWTLSERAPGDMPVSGAFVSIGTSVFHWGNDPGFRGGGLSYPVGWLWSP